MGRVFQDVTSAGATEGALDFALEDASAEEQRAILTDHFGGGAGGAAAADAYLAAKSVEDNSPSEDVTGPDLSSKDVGCQGMSNATPNNSKISRHFTIAQLSTSTPAGSHAIPTSKSVSVKGKMITLSRSEIICNLKFLAVNTLDPFVDWLNARGYGCTVGSAYRNYSDGSYHNHGAAADCYVTKNGQRVARETLRLVAMNFIKEGVAPRHQILVEWNGAGKPGWIHLANSRLGINPNAFKIGKSYDGIHVTKGFPSHS